MTASPATQSPTGPTAPAFTFASALAWASLPGPPPLATDRRVARFDAAPPGADIRFRHIRCKRMTFSANGICSTDVSCQM
jgi:hypothetical protein